MNTPKQVPEVRRSVARRVVMIMTALALAGGAIGVLPDAASATSTKCAFYGTGVKGVIKNGQFCATVHGSGTRIDRVTGNFGSTLPGLDSVCNPSIKIDVYNRYGQWVTWRQGTQRSGCSWGTWNWVNTLNVNASFPSASGGYVRVTLQSYGRSVVSTVHGLG